MRTHAATKLVCAALLALSGAAANAGIIVYGAQLSGPNESPPNASPGTGFANVTIDDVLNTMRVQVVFANLVAGVTASHIHVINGPGDANVADKIEFSEQLDAGVKRAHRVFQKHRRDETAEGGGRPHDEEQNEETGAERDLRALANRL